MFSRYSKWKQLVIISILAFVLIYFLKSWTEADRQGIGFENNRLLHLQHNGSPPSENVDLVKIKTNNAQEIKKVTVNVNKIQQFQGIQVQNELYVPFTFLSTYYDVFGKFTKSDEFTWYNVNPALIDLTHKYLKYTTTRQYLNFQNADVPKRARVKCICGRNEIPITTQWDPKGYYYPTQVAQYGLSYLSKYHIESKKRTQKQLKIERVVDDIPEDLFVLKLAFKGAHTPFQVSVLASDGQSYILSYVTDNSLIKRKSNLITHGIGEKLELPDNIITRDLNVDIMKGLSYREGQRNGKTVQVTILKIQQIQIENPKSVNGIRLVDIDFKAKFLAAANWFVKSQDEKGGWKVSVKRAITQGMEAAPGWYSAMGQGQAISLLARVYLVTKDMKYLNTALRSTKVFHKTAQENGVKADLFGLPWYEEYPTNPPSFVLNGFIFSLFGLYDLWTIAGDERGSEAGELFNAGFETLEKRIPLFDNGHNTFYDLRHLTLPGISPNRARWQYHNVHLEQLNAILSIRKSKILSDVLKRWTGYVSGVLSRHN